MGLFRTALRSLLVLGLAAPAAAATIAVTSTADSGAGSLRDAIEQSNASVGVLDTIAFAIPGAGVQTITLSAGLPIITDPVVIDGSTQPGFAGSPLIELTANPPGNIGIRVNGGGSTIRGLVINNFGTHVWLLTSGDNLVEGCYIGTNAAGTGGVTGGNGIVVQDSSNNTIGGTTAAARNIISTTGGSGIQDNSSDGTTVLGNYIGTDVTGTLDIGNSTGVLLSNATNATVGGGASGAGNLISGNSNGVLFSGGSGSVLAGNRIGTDVTGTQAIPNNFGFDSHGSATDFRIGGPGPGEGNLISGNTSLGVILNGVTDVVVQGNRIGTDVTGTLPLPNGLGILVNTIANTDILIGGTAPGEGNLIAFNAGAGGIHGIWNLGLRVTIRGNSIYDNDGLGLDNGNQGVQPNDPGDADDGANDGQNFPLVSSVQHLGPQGAGTRVQGFLRSTPSTTFTLDFYGNDGCTARPQDFLEGRTWLGEAQVTTDGTGSTAFDVTLPTEIGPQDFVSATATDPNGSTSEFSQRLPFSLFPTAGDAAGGAAVSIQGTDFADGATVTFGGVAASNVVVQSATQITATTPPLPAGTINNLTVTNVDLTTGTLPKAWVSDFLDVPSFHQFYSFVTTLVRNGITVGVGGGLYGVNDATLRQQMAVFLLRAKYGVCYQPPPCAGIFSDVPCSSNFAPWIEALAAEGITGGCGAGVYCPQNPVRRDQMAVFLLKTKYGSAYVPPDCTGDFDDVPCPGTFANWIEQLAAELITSGCGGNSYCPGNPNTRGQMAVFIVKTFSLQ